MKIKLIACEVCTREVGNATANSEHIFDSIYLPFGLHSTPNDLRARLQSEIDAVEGVGYDYIVLGYGLCSRGTAELVARSVPILIPRAHDCITLFLGSRGRYTSEFSEHPGTYYYSSGWIERGDGDVGQGMISDKKDREYKERFAEYVEKYGEDNAQFLMDQESQWLVNYTRAAFIKTGVGPTGKYREFTQGIASSRGWSYEEMEGDMSLIERLANGQWDGDDFLIVQPGEQVVESFDERIITSKR
jgi:hypothetical protein